MNLLAVLPFILLGLPLVVTIFEIFRRKDRGPREFPEQTTYEEKPDIDTPLLEKTREKARVKFSGEVLRITGDASIPDGTVMNNHLVVQGNLVVGRKCHIHGSIKAFGDVEVREASVIEGHILSEGNVTIKQDCVIKGIVDSLKDITLEKNAVVEAVSTEKTVKIGPNAKINRRILSGSSIVTLPPEMKEETPEKPKEPEVTSKPQAAVEQLPTHGQQKVEQVLPSPPREASKLDESEKIFSHLEEHIKRLSETKPRAAEEYELEGLSPLEVKVFKAALKCSAIEEICLRLLMDTAEAESILQGLVEKGFLDQSFKPKRPSAKEQARLKPSSQPTNILEEWKKLSSSESNFGQNKEAEKEQKTPKKQEQHIAEDAVKELREL